MDGLVGRDAELDAIGAWLNESADSPSALLIEGEPGIGKSALFAAGVQIARERSYLILRAWPAEPESGLAHAVLGDLLGPVADSVLERLPAPQRTALEAALLRTWAAGAEPDRLALGLGVRGALAILATRGPVLVAIDDAHWADEASTEALRFALRRLAGVRVRVLATLRTGVISRRPFGAGLPEVTAMPLSALSIGAVHAIVQARLELTLDRPRLRRLHELSGGNPFHALELGRAFKRGSLSLGADEALPRDLQALVGDRVAALPAPTVRLLGIAALASGPSLDLLAAVASAEEPARTLAPAVEADVVRIGDGTHGEIEFTHPLLASSAIAALTPAERRDAHRALASHVTDPVERARHLSKSVEGTDEATAALLEVAAATAMARGAPTVAADLAGVARSTTPGDRAPDVLRRAAAEAEYRFEAGDSAGAASILDQLIAQLEPGPARAEFLAHRARITHFGDDVGAGVALLRAALAEAGPNIELRAGIEEGLAWGLMLMRVDLPEAAAHAASAARQALRIGDDALRAEALAATALTRLVIGRPASAPMAKALALEPATLGLRVLRHPSFALAYQLTCRDELDAARDVLTNLAARANERGDESAMATILLHRSLVEVLAGNTGAASSAATDAHELALENGQRPARAAALARLALVHAVTGDEAAARDAATASLRLAGGDDFDPARPAAALARGGELALWAMSLLGASLGHWADALRFASPLADHMLHAGVREPGEMRFLIDEVEALLATGDTGRAVGRVVVLEAMAVRTRRPSARVTAVIGRSLLRAEQGDLDGAAAALDPAVRSAERLPLPLLAGRALLALGRVQRRARRRAAARASLTAARERFENLGAASWAATAHQELGRIGGRTSSGTELTTTESEVARLVATGLSNKEVAATLFVTPKAIEATLARVYAKRGVRSRTELAHVMGTEPEGNT